MRAEISCRGEAGHSGRSKTALAPPPFTNRPTHLAKVSSQVQGADLLELFQDGGRVRAVVDPREPKIMRSCMNPAGWGNKYAARTVAVAAPPSLPGGVFQFSKDLLCLAAGDGCSLMACLGGGC